MSAELMKSKIVRRTFVASITSEIVHGFLSNFGCGFPWAIYAQIFFFFIFFMKISKRYSSYKSQPKVFRLS